MALTIAEPESQVTVKDIHKAINITTWGSIFVPEFTYYDLRIDGILIDPSKRMIRGYEIKVSRGDFLQDEKWQNYSRFCSSLSVACPSGLIQADEIPSPFGLLWVSKEKYKDYGGAERWELKTNWIKKPKKFNSHKGLAWTWTYFEVLELEFKRIAMELRSHNASH